MLRGERPEMLVVGSHLDSVPKGGWLDGALGVMAGLELLRALAAEGTPPVTVALVDWADEEGARFGRSLFGSAATVGTLDLDVLRGLHDKEGNALPDVLGAHGVDIEHLDAARTRLADVKAYAEVHIEQGPVLESKGLGICTVTGTKGIERERVTFTGQASHAGTMPMDMRRDSFRAAARFALGMADVGVRHDGVTTVGSATLWPGVVTATAGVTSVTLDMRHTDADALAAMFADAHEVADGAAAAEGCTVEWEHIFRIPPMAFHPALLDAARVRRPRDRGPRRGAAERCAARRERDGPGGADGDDLLQFDRWPQPHEGGGHAGRAPRDGGRSVPPHLPRGDRPDRHRPALTRIRPSRVWLSPP